MALILCLLFFLSGASALVFETLWFRQAGLAFGTSVWASSLVLSAFMAGLGVGNALSARLGDRIRRPVATYAVLEAVIALSGVALVIGLPLVGPALAPWLRGVLDEGWTHHALRSVVAFALLLVPSTAMGMTLPLLTRALVARDPNFGLAFGRLYGWNTLGAVVGALGSEAFLVGALGIRGSAYAAGGLNLAAAVLAGLLAFRLGPTAIPTTPRAVGTLSRRAVVLLAAAAGSGFALLALEVVWFRLLLLFVYGTSSTFALMLGVVLAGIGFGGLLAARWLRRDPDAHAHAGSFAFLAGLLGVVGYYGFGWIVQPVQHVVVGSTFPIAVLALWLMFPVSLVSGVLFTLVGTAIRSEIPSETRAAGLATLANTMGAAAGSLAGGLLLLPVLGTEKSLFALTVVYGGIGVLLMAGAVERWRLAAHAGALLVAFAVFPFGQMRDHFFPLLVERIGPGLERTLVASREGTNETIVYAENRIFGRLHSYELVTNGYSMSGSDWASRRYMKLYVYWPAAVHPDLKDALLVSYGVGSTAKALVDTPGLERLDIVDISRDVVALNRIVYPESKDYPPDDPRVHVHVEDGRYFLQTTDRRFDLITAEPPPPAIAGVVNLYTREYFALARERLNEGGMLTHWLPIHSLSDASSRAIMRGFCEVFEDCSLWHGMGHSLMLVGTRGATGPVSDAVFRRQWEVPQLAGEMRALGIERPEQLGALFVGDAAYIDRVTRDSAPLVDDWPRRIQQPNSETGWPSLYREWLDEDAARERFRVSPLVERLWPPAMRDATLPYFAVQGVIDRYAFHVKTAFHDRIADLHTVLTTTDLHAPVLWLLGSDADRQQGLPDPEGDSEESSVLFERAIGAFAERAPLRAADRLRVAASRSAGFERWRAQALRVYALCLGGRTDEARQFVEKRRDAFPVAGEWSLYWDWINATFGIDPRQRTR